MKNLKRMIVLAVLATSTMSFAQSQGSRNNRYNCGAACNPTQTQVQIVSTNVSMPRLNSYMTMVQDLRDYVTPAEYGEFIQPLKRAVSNTQAMLDVYGPMHIETAKAFMELINTADAASDLFSDLEDRDAFFYTIQDLKKTILIIKRASIN